MQDYLRFSQGLDGQKMVSVFEESSLWCSRFGLFLLENLELQPDLHILDLACGTGFPLFELAHMYGTSCQLTGVDNWPEAIARAREKLSIYQLPNVYILEADAQHLPLPDANFDVIISNLGINNFDDPDAVLAECFRVAKSGCRLILTTNPIGHMHEFYAVFRSVLQELRQPLYLERLERNGAHRGSKEGLIELLQRHGFRVGKLKEEQFQLRYLNGSALLNHSLTKLGFLDGWKQVVDPEDQERTFAMLEDRLNQIAQKAGELRMTVPMLYLEAEKSV